MTRRSLLATLAGFLAAPFVAKAKPFPEQVAEAMGPEFSLVKTRRVLHFHCDWRREWEVSFPGAFDVSLKMSPEMGRSLADACEKAGQCDDILFHDLTPLHKITGERFAAHVTEERA